MGSRIQGLLARLPQGVRDRFRAFALSHMVISGLSALAFLALVCILPGRGMEVLLPVSLAGYAFSGFKLAREDRWERLLPGQALAAFALPAAVALAWGLLGMGLLFLGRVGSTLGLFLLMTTVLFAHPSFAIMFLSLEYFNSPMWYALLLVAALLPPALFTLGTLLGRLGQDREAPATG